MEAIASGCWWQASHRVKPKDRNSLPPPTPEKTEVGAVGPIPPHIGHQKINKGSAGQEYILSPSLAAFSVSLALKGCLVRANPVPWEGRSVQ